MITNNLDLTIRMPLSSEVIFYTIADIQEMTHWSEATVQKLFNDPRFPATDFGRTKVVESHALINYFSERHNKAKDPYWR
ncbi:MAG: hypothetical protein ACI4EF_10770 [Coprococcus sp.]